jgi:hypothetical protein
VIRRGLLLLCAVSLLAVPTVANGRQLDLYRSDDAVRRDDRRSLQVVGLTTDGRLVRFDAAPPAGPGASARSRAWPATSRWSASTTASRTAGSTASATPGALDQG